MQAAPKTPPMPVCALCREEIQPDQRSVDTDNDQQVHLECLYGAHTPRENQ